MTLDPHGQRYNIRFNRARRAERDALRNAADVKARIAVYGSADVIRSLARFEETGASLISGPSVNAFVSLVSGMRPKSGSVAVRDLSLLLLGRDGPRS